MESKPVLHLKFPTATSGQLTVARLKITTALRPDELLGVPAPEGKPHVTLHVRATDGRVLSADIATKSLRKAQAAVRELGADNVALLLQGHLVAGDVIAEAGLSAQPKTPKPSSSAA